MSKSTMAVVIGAIAAVTVSALTLTASAATYTNKPPPINKVGKPVVLISKLYCQVGKSGEFGTYQVINKGNAAAPKGTVFAYSVTAPKGFPAKQTYTLTAALAPGKFVNMTKPMSSNMVGTCSPTAP